MANSSSYERLSVQKYDVSIILDWHFKSIIGNINRRLSFKQRFKNPWKIEVTEKIHRDIFIKAFQAIRDYDIEYGRTYSVKRDKNKICVLYNICFTHLGALKFHLHKLSGFSKEEIDKKFNKAQKNKGKAYIVVSEEKPATIVYNCRNTTLTFNVSYEVENVYGNLCSF